MRLANPEALLLLAVIPALVAIRVARRRSRPAIVIPSVSGLRALPVSPRAALQPVLLVLQCLTIGLIVVALARPQLAAPPPPVSTNAVDIFVVLDVSSSMASADYPPLSRFDVAKRVITSFVEGRPGDRLGLITFARYSTLKCPLTIDHEILKFQLDGAEMATGDDDGTAIGMALASAVNHMRRSPAESRAIVLLTDGENNRSTIDPATGAELARAMGVRVYAIGVGKEAVDEGSPTGATGAQQVQSPGFNQRALKSIAQATGGAYFRAADVTTLEQVFRTIDSLERSPVPVPQPGRSTELFWIAAAAALAAGVLELVLRSTALRSIP